MANVGESLLNVVIDNRLKVLRSLTKRYVAGSGVANSPDADTTATGGEAEPNPCMVHVRNVVSRSILLIWSGKHAVRCANGVAGRG
jgi:hypothetical protein